MSLNALAGDLMDDALIWNELQRVAERVRDRVALQSSEPGAPRYTYREMIDRATAVGCVIAKTGVQVGDRVALWSPVSPSWAIAYLGILSSGGVVVPLDASGSTTDAAAVLRATDCSLLIGAHDVLTANPLERVADTSVRVVQLDELINDAGQCSRTSAGPHDATPRPAVHGTDIATIIFTSGTTGDPRGVVISHAAVNAAVTGMRQYMDLSPDDNVLAVVPSHHVFAPVGNLLVPLAAGATVTYVSIKNSAELLRIVRDVGITVFPSVPQVFYALHRRILDQVRERSLAKRWLFLALLRVCRGIRRYRLNPGRTVFSAVHAALGGTLRVFLSGGSYCDPAVIRDLDALGFTFLQGYGLTETFGGGTLTSAHANRPGSVGVPLPAMQVRIIGADAEGVGEIAIKGPCVFQGYLHDIDATAAVLRDGWLHTGDVGYLDDAGRLYVTGRRTDFIVLSSGKKVAPETLERHYGQSRAILEICVMGVRQPSDYAGSQRLHAVIVPDFEFLKGEGIVNSREVIRSEVERLSRELPAHQRALSYEVRPTPLPRTPTKKIVRWQVAAENAVSDKTGQPRADDAQHDADDELCQLEPCRRVLELIREEARVDRLPDPSMNLELDLGVDSLQRIELIATVERAMHVRLPGDATSQCITVRDVLRATVAALDEARTTEIVAQADRRVRWRDILGGPEVAEVDEPVLHVHPSMSSVQFAALRTIRVAAAALFRFSVRGIENLPPHGAYLICPNHQSYLDGALVACALPYSVTKRFVTLGWPAFFSGGMRALLARATNCVPIDPDTNLRRAMIVSAAALQRGRVVLIFPEGGLSWDGKLQPFKKGPAILAHELKVPIVPVGITGTFAVWPKGRLGPRRLGRVGLTIGQPIQIDGQRHSAKTADGCVEEIARRLREDIGALVGAEH